MSAAPDFDPEYGSPAEWARQYRRLGLQIVPGYMPSEVPKGAPYKRPRFNEWVEFQEALVDDAVFDRWYGPQGQYVSHLNMGVIAGRCSDNLFVIDLDIHKGPTALQWWLGVLALHNNGMEIETAEQRTGGGGVQKLFRAPTGWHCPTNRTSIGVDIRGQGGFAVFAPSLHDSGRNYEWLPGRAPWDDCGIAMAPQWLFDAVVALVGAHGGDSGAHPKTRTASPGGDFDSFGHQHDGREEKMRDLIWAAIVDWYRECPIKPGEQEQLAKAREKYLVYEELVVSRLFDPSKTKTQLLEQEARGPTEFWSKWRATMRHWDDKVRADAAKPNPKPDERARDYTAEFAKARDNAEEQAKVKPLLGWDAGEDTVMPPPREWLLGTTFCRGFGSSLLGDGGVGKTALRYAQMLSVATWRPLTGEHVFQRCRVLILSLEDGANELRRRLLAARLHHKIDQSELKGWLFMDALCRKDGKLMVLDPYQRPIIDILTARLERTIIERRIDLVMLDPFIKSHSLAENDNNAIDEVATVITDICIAHNIAFDVPHHTAKGLPDPGNANKGRGASALKDALRLVRTATAMSPEEAKALGLDEAQRRRLIRIDDAKINIAPMGETKWFRLVGVNIGNGTAPYPNGDNVQTVEPWTPPNPLDGMTGADFEKAAAAIRRGKWRESPQAKAWVGYAVADALRLDASKDGPGRDRARVIGILKAWLKAGSIIVVERPDEHREMKKFVEVKEEDE